MSTDKSEEFVKFDEMMHKLIKVPHATIKAKLDAEKASKRVTKRKRERSTASRSEASGNERTDPET